MVDPLDMDSKKVCQGTNQLRCMNIDELAYWNSRTYGNALRIPKNILRGAITLGCIFTPFTNWLIPIALKYINRDLVVRY